MARWPGVILAAVQATPRSACSLTAAPDLLAHAPAVSCSTTQGAPRDGPVQNVPAKPLLVALVRVHAALQMGLGRAGRPRSSGARRRPLRRRPSGPSTGGPRAARSRSWAAAVRSSHGFAGCHSRSPASVASTGASTGRSRGRPVPRGPRARQPLAGGTRTRASRSTRRRAGRARPRRPRAAGAACGAARR